MRKIKVSDLKDQIGVTNDHRFLLCRVCCSQNSANLGDYFNLSKNHVFMCCDRPMGLFVKKTIYQEVA